MRQRKSDPRQFGLLLGVFLGVATWRLGAKGHHGAALVAGACALSSTALAWLRPAALAPVERGWVAAAKVVAKVNTFLVLAIVYYVILTPFSLVYRLFSGDPLERARGAGSYWKRRTSGEDLRAYERQF